MKTYFRKGKISCAAAVWERSEQILQKQLCRYQGHQTRRERRCSRCQSRFPCSPWCKPCWCCSAPAAHGGPEWSTNPVATHEEPHTRAGERALRICVTGTAHAGACSWQELRHVMSTHRIKFSGKNYSLWGIHPRTVLQKLKRVERTHMWRTLSYGRGPTLEGRKEWEGRSSRDKVYKWLQPTFLIHPAPIKTGGGRKFNSTIERQKKKGDKKGVFSFVLFLIILLC